MSSLQPELTSATTPSIRTCAAVSSLTLVENPDLATGRRFGHSMPVVIHQDPFVLGLPSKVDAELFRLFNGRIEVLWRETHGPGLARETLHDLIWKVRAPACT